ncbi:hypothetical protein ABZP36_017448 [Zizania latifolia]
MAEHFVRARPVAVAQKSTKRIGPLSELQPRRCRPLCHLDHYRWKRYQHLESGSMILRNELKPSNQPFHGITLESSTKPFRQTELPITSGTPGNFRMEREFETAYKAILKTSMA